MYHTTERNERRSQRHALVLAVALHFALVAMLYFKMSGEAVGRQAEQPSKINMPKSQAPASARTVQYP